MKDQGAEDIAKLSHRKNLVTGPLLVLLPLASQGTTATGWWPLGHLTLGSADIADAAMLIQISNCSCILHHSVGFKGPGRSIRMMEPKPHF